MNGWDSVGAYTTTDMKNRNSGFQVLEMLITQRMGCNSGMKRVYVTNSLLQEPKTLMFGGCLGNV
ncbi:hypothetical protein YC2023_118883 [Brassica napus]